MGNLENLKSYWESEIRAKSGNKLTGEIPYKSLSEPLGGGFREMLWPGCFTESIRNNDIYFLDSHMHSMSLGSTASGTLKIYDTPSALKFELTLPDTQAGRDLHESVARGDKKKMSFGFNIIDSELDEINGESVNIIRKGILHELSCCVWPAYESTSVLARSQTNNRTNEFRNYFTARGKKSMKRVDKFFSKDPWRNNNEYLTAVINAANDLTRPEDPRLMRATGLGEESQSEGGFLIKKELMDTFLYGETASDLYRRCSKVPVGEGFFRVELPMVAEISRAEGSHLGGLRLYFEGEADDVETSTPKFRLNSLSLKKAIGICPITDELLTDGPRMERFLSNVFGRALRYTIDDSILRGNGAGRPLGLMQAPGTLTIAAEGGQDAGTVISQNILNMVAALPAESHGNACWVVNPELLEQLYKLQVQAGTGGGQIGLWKWRSGGELYSKLAGFDCIPNEHCSAPGETGDIFLADFSQVAFFEKQIRETTSAHLYWTTGQSAFRLVYRFDSQPLWNAPITPKHGTTGKKISPYIKLADRA